MRDTSSIMSWTTGAALFLCGLLNGDFLQLHIALDRSVAPSIRRCAFATTAACSLSAHHEILNVGKIHHHMDYFYAALYFVAAYGVGVRKWSGSLRLCNSR
jgi:hypothetical protein